MRGRVRAGRTIPLRGLALQPTLFRATPRNPVFLLRASLVAGLAVGRVVVVMGVGKEKCPCWLDVGNTARPAYNIDEERYPEPPPMPTRKPAPFYTLHVKLEGIAPPIWRWMP
ncbi:hypothetical protein JKG47_17870 [Acidithiobacillus sp. MC6.1]|nr:hypothetical protein [Acidithiobacillus sp. MC6.1]